MSSARKGYEIGPASNLQVGDVFEFLWADASEFEWEWKCLGYTRFIVLRHSDTFPHHCVCIPISVGTKHDFAKPGIDHFQQGFVFANGDRNPGCEQPGGGPKLPYSPVGIELRPGRLRVKEDSRANYADTIDVDGDAQVMVVGDVAMYFDRVRRNVNRASMRQVLRKALEEYRKNGKVGSGAGGSGSNNNDGGAPATYPDANSPGRPASLSAGALPMIHESGSMVSLIQPVMDRKGSITPSPSGALLGDRTLAPEEAIIGITASATAPAAVQAIERDGDFATDAWSDGAGRDPSPSGTPAPTIRPPGLRSPVDAQRRNGRFEMT
ncbi:hypothetical protein UCREL1_5636 [Eutypa lata UCREL1]|uniref:DUF6590 domain-containing protein n=1 Tax=Eutypa lata (strain UCR-EL1) TaxID=1287681 RepID=M7TBT2_EUTLA|nr:hypothetical protein UCREL1_5636 [Eutypa lata UCREL1]